MYVRLFEQMILLILVIFFAWINNEQVYNVYITYTIFVLLPNYPMFVLSMYFYEWLGKEGMKHECKMNLLSDLTCYPSTYLPLLRIWNCHLKTLSISSQAVSILWEKMYKNISFF